VAKVEYGFIKSYLDRHGKPRHYFRKKGCKSVTLPGLPGSEEFNRAYEQALAGAPRIEIAASRTRAGSINAMIVGYLASAAFAGLASNTQPTYRRILEGIRREHGDMSVATLQRRHVVQMLDAKKDTPGTSRSFLKCVRLIIQYAINIGIRQDDPTAGLRVKQPKTGGHPTWSEQNIAAFRTAYPIGTKPRLAMELLLGTALRCADVVKLGRGHVHDGILTVPATKKTGMPLEVEVSAGMAAAINTAAPSEHVTFLINERGRSFGPKKFGEWFSEQCRRAGLEDISAHGLRKAACRRMAEAECTAPEIAAVSTHRSLAEVQRYIDAADRVKLARSPMKKLRVVE
jgi:integrase